MKIKLLLTTTISLIVTLNLQAQCLNGGCEVGLSRSHSIEGEFIGHYENGEKQGLGITYKRNIEGLITTYSNYDSDKKTGVAYQLEYDKNTQASIHTFISYEKGVAMYPALRISKVEKKATIEVSFSESDGWEKFDGTKTKEDLQVNTTIYEGTPTFFAFNDGKQIIAISKTVGSINLLTSKASETYFNGLQVESNDNRLLVSVFPKAGADKTIFRTNNITGNEGPEEGLWLYRRYFDNELSYKLMYEDVLELPSQQDVRQQKLQKAFDFVAEQVNDYDFQKGYKGRAQDFIDTLNDIRSRAESKGLAISATYDIIMVELLLHKGDSTESLRYAKSAYEKSSSSYASIDKLILTKFENHTDLLTKIKNKTGEELVGNN